ncbi:MAG: M14 family zinc carboxypeptidase [bacterium]
MVKKYALLLAIIWLFVPSPLYSQDRLQSGYDSIFNKWGEIYFKFNVTSEVELNQLTRIISIDNYSDHTVTAYASRKQFTDFLAYGYKVSVLPNPGGLLSEKELSPDPATRSGKGALVWNFYPTYQQYIDTMFYFASAFPLLCRLDTIGTSVQGRLILALKISDNVNVEEAEPEFFYTSSIHGDETTGYILMLHLIDSLLTTYDVSPRITGLINNTEIYINPLANPDGTYHGGNNSVSGAVRDNANGYDLNRNFPDPAGTYTGPRQKETLAFMNFAGKHHFVMSANFHGGAEVFNYPWDCWTRLTADDDWWYFAGREYADTVHKFSPASYFNLMNNGVTNGAEWYIIYGGRQDYMNYYRGCREVTLEVSNTKLLPSNQLIKLWNYNHNSLLNYLERVNYGLQGVITDTVTGEPIDSVKVYISGFDKDNSWVYSKLPSGFYTRPIFDGSYNVTFSATGYFPKTLDITVTNYSTTIMDVQLKPITYGISEEKSTLSGLVCPNPNGGQFTFFIPGVEPGEVALEVMNLLGKPVFKDRFYREKGMNSVKLDIGENPPGIYFISILFNKDLYLEKILVR